MKTILVTGGTVFASRFAAEYFVKKGWRVYVLNRGSRPQSDGVMLIRADRHALGDTLRGCYFDAVLDITAYTGNDVNSLLDSLDGFGEYIFVSSSAVYPETTPQPFSETSPTGANRIWGRYGADKAQAERVLLSRCPNAYILRLPYLYGPMNNIYREAFVFDCALSGRRFCLPQDGAMSLQFLHISDLCRFMEMLLEKRSEQHIFNVGNSETVTIRDWASLCYRAAGKEPCFFNVRARIEQRNYFCFYDYDYRLDVSAQNALLPTSVPLEQGLRESLQWYLNNPGGVIKKPYLEFIDDNFNALERKIK